MATVYISPSGIGGQTGVDAANAYPFTSLNAAEADAGNNGTIYFTDGTYTIINTTWDPLVDNMTYKALNKHEAILTSVIAAALRFGASSTPTRNVTFDGFKVNGGISYLSQSTSILKNILHIDTYSSAPQYATIWSYPAPFTLMDCSFTLDRSATKSLFYGGTTDTIMRCSFFIKCSTLGTNGVTGSGTNPTTTNTIISTDNPAAIAASAITPASYTNCCLYNLHSGDTSGGTNNIFVDPLFVDTASGDLRLRPTSPCINAGTA